MSKKTILYPQTMDYHRFHQRCHSLMEQFAKHGWRVIWHNLTERAIPPERIARNFWIYHNMDDLEDDFESFDVIFAHWARHHHHPIPHSILIHDCTDWIEQWQEYERQICKTADIITCVSEPLKRYFKREFNRDAVVISNAAEYDFLNSNKKEPKEFKGVERPILGFIGSVGPWSDISIFKILSEHFTTFCIGLYAHRQKKPRKFRYISHQPWERMPEFYNNVDVGIIPMNDGMTATHCVPNKAWEYLACGKPVVSTENEQLEKDLGDLVTILPVAKTRRDRMEWVRAVKREIRKDNDKKRQYRKDRMKKETWDKRYHEFEALIEEKL